MLINWTKTEIFGGFIYDTDDVDGYDIYQEASPRDKFYVRVIGADRDPIGPLDDFKAAEDIIIKIGITLIQYEEMLWKVMAAQALKVVPMMIDGTANQIEDTAP